MCFYSGEKIAYFSSGERKFLTQVLRLHNSHPTLVRILKTPEENNGVIYCELPSTWFRLRVPTKRELTEEQRQSLREAMACIRTK